MGRGNTRGSHAICFPPHTVSHRDDDFDHFHFLTFGGNRVPILLCQKTADVPASLAFPANITFAVLYLALPIRTTSTGSKLIVIVAYVYVGVFFGVIPAWDLIEMFKTDPAISFVRLIDSALVILAWIAFIVQRTKSKRSSLLDDRSRVTRGSGPESTIQANPNLPGADD